MKIHDNTIVNSDVQRQATPIICNRVLRKGCSILCFEYPEFHCCKTGSGACDTTVGKTETRHFFSADYELSSSICEKKFFVRFPAAMILLAFRSSIRPMTGLIGVSRLMGRSLSSLFRRRPTTSTCLLSAQTSNYFLLKSDHSEFSIQDPEECVEEEWDGVRNYQARNKLRAMKVGDLVYFYYYHSSCSVPNIVGTMRIVQEVARDETALELNHNEYDPKSTPENCRWDAVRLRFETKFHEPATLWQLKKRAKEDLIFSSLSLLQQSRLSVHSLSMERWNAIASLADPAAKEESEPKFFVIKSNPSKFSIQDLSNQHGMEGYWTFSGKDKLNYCNQSGLVFLLSFITRVVAFLVSWEKLKLSEKYNKESRLSDLPCASVWKAYFPKR